MSRSEVFSLSIEKTIIQKLLESREQQLAVYKGFSIRMDYDNIVKVYNHSGACVAQFENTKEAYDYIDDLPLKEKNPPKNLPTQPMYYIYSKGTLDGRKAYAKYLSKRKRQCEWSYEKDADTYTKRERDAILRNSKTYDSYKA